MADQYGVWNTDDESEGYWLLFDSIEDAVSDRGDNCEVYEMRPRLLGKFVRKVEMVVDAPKTRKAKR